MNDVSFSKHLSNTIDDVDFDSEPNRSRSPRSMGMSTIINTIDNFQIDSSEESDPDELHNEIINTPPATSPPLNFVNASIVDDDIIEEEDIQSMPNHVGMATVTRLSEFLGDDGDNVDDLRVEKTQSQIDDPYAGLDIAASFHADDDIAPPNASKGGRRRRHADTVASNELRFNNDTDLPDITITSDSDDSQQVHLDPERPHNGPIGNVSKKAIELLGMTQIQAQHQERRIVFIRSGKSKWNEETQTGIFSKMNAWKRGYYERQAQTQDPHSGDHLNSSILDAPLSREGILQAKKLSKFLRLQKLSMAFEHVQTLRDTIIDQLEEALQYLNWAEESEENLTKGLGLLQTAWDKLPHLDEHIMSHIPPDIHRLQVGPKSSDKQNIIETLLVDRDNCVITTSNLRRSISTALISLEERFKNTIEDPSEDPLYVLSCLQEIVSNFDNRPLNDIPSCSPHMMAAQSQVNVRQVQKDYIERLNNSYNRGDETETPVQDRFKDYLDWIFEENEKRTVVTFGHGRWFQEFFKMLIDNRRQLPRKVDVKKKKLNDCSMIAFNLTRYKRPRKREWQYLIHVESLLLIHDKLIKAA